MSDAASQSTPSACIIAVLGALVLFSVLSQVLEASLVRAVGGDAVKAWHPTSRCSRARRCSLPRRRST